MKPSDQPRTLPRWRRQASPSGERSPRPARAGPGRVAMMPASRSRRALRAYATAATTIASARTIGSTHQRSSPYGRRRWSSPIGETHDNGEFRSPPASPTTRRRKLTPSTRMVIQRAARALWVSWAATAATAVKSQPATAYSRPSATEPAAPKPSPVRPTAIRAPSRVDAPSATAVAAARPACRPTTVDPSSSRRPCSSSARVCRITVRPTASALISRTMLDRHAVIPPRFTAKMGP